jgi:uncharacterized protein (DUF1697 family)
MALVVLLRGMNVGGHRRFRPSLLASRLKALDVVSVGAAGTFVVRKPVRRTEIRAEIARRLPFETRAVICDGDDVLGLVSRDPFAGQDAGPDLRPFVSVMARRRDPRLTLPMTLPEEGDWCVKLLERRDRFVCGLHRRQMRAITHLGRLDALLGVPLTTRSWSTFLAVERALRA